MALAVVVVAAAAVVVVVDVVATAAAADTVEEILPVPSTHLRVGLVLDRSR